MACAEFSQAQSGAATHVEDGFTPLDNLPGLMRLGMTFDPIAETMDNANDSLSSAVFTAEQGSSSDLCGRVVAYKYRDSNACLERSSSAL